MANKKPTNDGEFDTVPDIVPVFWKDYSEGDSITGLYCGYVDTEGQGDSQTFKSHRIRQDDGVTIGISGSTLDERMATVPIGVKVRVTYEGTEKSAKGRTMKMFSVQVAKGTRLIDKIGDIAAAAQ